MLSEERSNFERLLVAVSTTLNQDLPARLQEVGGLGDPKPQPGVRAPKP